MNPADYYTLDYAAIRTLPRAQALDLLDQIRLDVTSAVGAERTRLVAEEVAAQASAHGPRGAQRRAAAALGMKPANLGRLYTDSRETPMTTTEYGNFNVVCADAGSCRTFADYVATALGDYVDDYDVDAIVSDFRDAINTQLDGTGVSLHGDIFYGPHPREDIDIAGAIESVDFWVIAEKHDTPTPS